MDDLRETMGGRDNDSSSGGVEDLDVDSGRPLSSLREVYHFAVVGSCSVLLFILSHAVRYFTVG